ncbi:putative methyltransferase DDB_G0268948 isoform X2 [Hyperolius riggenbachi]|uniref:putative methyltransferase DDB_G0268948 isoform X2 n=1 Tax=Hyperolius riggenbachi TaxID=752182 RepID=UPI0035A348C4
MSTYVFKEKQFSSLYHKYIISGSSEIMAMILSYVAEKKGLPLPLSLAVDVGCGTGKSTLPLAPHFKSVLGIDFSDSQINMARQCNAAENVSYTVASAEQMPLEDESVDLVNAGFAVHFFDQDKFLSEAVRVMNKNGCLALHACHPSMQVEYKNLSQDLTQVMHEAMANISKFDCNSFEHLSSQYQSIYEAVPLKDKKWITDITEKVSMSTAGLIGLLQAICCFQIFKDKDPNGANELLKNTEQRLHDLLGEDAESAVFNVYFKHHCVLACKS